MDYVAGLEIGLERTAVCVEDAARRLMPSPLPAAASPSRSRIAGATRVTMASMSSEEGSGLGL